MSTAPTSYTTADRAAIFEYYGTEGTVDLNTIAAEIAKAAADPNYQPSVNVGDLLSFYIAESGQLPECMAQVADGLVDPNTISGLWTEEVVEAVQDWRSLNVSNEELATLISDLESFLTVGGGECHGPRVDGGLI